MNTYAGAKLSLRELAAPTCLALATCAAPIFFYEGPLERPLAMVAAISFLGFFVVVWIIPRVTHKFPACLQGKDLGKAGTPHSETKVPEGVGLISGGVQIMCLVFVMVFCRIPRDGSILGSGEGCPPGLD